MNGYNRLSKTHNTFIPNVVLVASLAFFIGNYNKDNSRKVIPVSNSNSYALNMEAILLKEEDLYGAVPVVLYPKNVKNYGNICGKLVGTNYVRKQQM